MGNDRPLLCVEDLRVAFPGAGSAGELAAVRGVSLSLKRGETLALVGESGCGKSVTALSVIGLVPSPGRVTGGRVLFDGRDLTSLSSRALRSVRGREVGMVFQEPMTSLNPVFTVGYQLAEALTAHRKLPRAELRGRCLELLREVGIPAPEERLGAYPSQLSGGLRQRVMIAIAVACRPRLLIADEPTTALDVTIQAQIMALLGRLRRELGMALLLITHDLGLVAQNVERVAVMYAGHVVEECTTRHLFASPLHPYTRGLLGSVPGASGVGRGGRLQAISGNVPHPSRVPSGCPFRDRCPLAADPCAAALPELAEVLPGRRVRCIRVERRV
ncbi:MAG: ABC transporter ATP-binding protein [Deferrisomatales bacterium]|nr:ABC transporter ATP-binding protein [Deferrisomatales bacterium]